MVPFGKQQEILRAKPVHPSELLAKVRAAMAARQPTAKSMHLVVDADVPDGLR
jgi:DNA-binding response OmpR family regulator